MHKVGGKQQEVQTEPLASCINVVVTGGQPVHRFLVGQRERFDGPKRRQAGSVVAQTIGVQVVVEVFT